MPQIKAAKKYVRKTKRRTKRNLAAKKKLKVVLKKANELLDAGELSGVEDAIKKAQKTLDKAAKKHIIHKNKAARIKRQLSRKLQKKKTKK